jgi:predicted transcriptional regulator
MKKTYKLKVQKRLFTKQEIKLIAELWESETTETIAEKLGRPKSSIQYMVTQIRKLGYVIPRKKKNNVTNNLIHEALENSGLVFNNEYAKKS